MKNSRLIAPLLCVTCISMLLTGCKTETNKSDTDGLSSISIETTESTSESTSETTSTSTITTETTTSVIETESDTTESNRLEFSYDIKDWGLGNSDYDIAAVDFNWLTEFPYIYDSVEQPDAAYITLNGNRPIFTCDFIDCLVDESKTYEHYSNLDALNRCGSAYAVICSDIMPTEKRGEIGSVKPSGWQTAKYDKSIISDMYLYNRCHLIGYQLAGENANELNLITGTRFMNVQGMLPFENLIADYIDNNPDNHVLMQVTPVFDADNLVAHGVVMSAISCEDRGNSVSFCIFCPNVQPLIGIDYATGDNWENTNADWYDGEITSFINDDTPEEPEETVTEEITSEPDNTVIAECDYILNTNSMKYHLPDCESAEKISDKNRSEYVGDAADLKVQGYSPCQNCLR